MGAQVGHPLGRDRGAHNVKAKECVARQVQMRAVASSRMAVAASDLVGGMEPLCHDRMARGAGDDVDVALRIAHRTEQLVEAAMAAVKISEA